jgi:hypothetical protein
MGSGNRERAILNVITNYEERKGSSLDRSRRPDVENARSEENMLVKLRAA